MRVKELFGTKHVHLLWFPGLKEDIMKLGGGLGWPNQESMSSLQN